MKKSNVSELVETGEKNKFYWCSEWMDDLRPVALKRVHHKCQKCNPNRDSVHYPNTRKKKETESPTQRKP